MVDYVYGPIYSIVNTRQLPVSHRSGWALYWAEMMNAKLLTSAEDAEVESFLRPGDRVLCYHGMEIEAFLAGRPLNVYAGTEEEFAERLRRLVRLAKRLGPDLVSLDRPMPNYGALYARRAAYPSWSSTAWNGFRFAAVDRALGKSSTLLYPTGRTKEIIFGDSHTLAMWRPGARVVRNDGMTLFGAVGKNLSSLVGKFQADLTLYLGNIDLRHHLAREDAADFLDPLLERYEIQLKEIQKANPKSGVTLVQPLPIEAETRRVPRTIFYKGKPFFGSWSERVALRARLDNGLRKVAKNVGASYYTHPEEWTLPSGELDQSVMERPSSIHIRPDFYRARLDGYKWKSFKEVVRK